jgi:oligopeptide/dipeptide ABC transporter ATP-binding protein
MTPPLLSLDSVTTHLHADHRAWSVVDDVSFELYRGEVIGLVGESGSGKSMTARTILRLLPKGASTRGAIRLEDTDLLSLGNRALRETRARRIAVIFQDPRAHIDPLWTIGDYLTEGLRVHRGVTRSRALRTARQLLADVGIEDGDRVLGSYPHQLSGGMLQRVMIAAAIAMEPDLIIADEPTTALDVTIQREIITIFDQLRRQRRVAMLFITHDLDLAAVICDRILVMYAGRIVEQQPTNDLFADPLHPYSAALLNARPRIDSRLDRLSVIPGRPAHPDEAPSGCPFHPRCRFAEDRCRRERPPLKWVSADAATACLRSEELRGTLGHDG